MIFWFYPITLRLVRHHTSGVFFVRKQPPITSPVNSSLRLSSEISNVAWHGNLKPPCHCKVIIQTCWLCVCSAMSVFIPCFYKLFRGHGSFSLGDQVNPCEFREAGQSHRGPLQAENGERTPLQVIGESPTLLLVHSVGINTFYCWDYSWTPTRINPQGCFLKTALALTMCPHELDIC